MNYESFNRNEQWQEREAKAAGDVSCIRCECPELDLHKCLLACASVTCNLPIFTCVQKLASLGARVFLLRC